MIEFDDRDFTIEAAWFYSGEDEPIRNVAIDVVGQRVADIHPLRTTHSTLAVIPPIANAHTHLELSDISNPFPPGEAFPDWIRHVIKHRAERSSDGAAVFSGSRELIDSGTLVVGDTIPMGESRSSPKEFHLARMTEYIGLDDDRVAAAIAHVTRVCPPRNLHWSAKNWISPHAPYSVRPDLFDLLTATARQQQRGVMMHLAETRDELELLEQGTGPFSDMLRAFGVWESSLFPSRSLCDYIDGLAAAPQAVVAHGNYLGEREIELLAVNPHMTVAYCPRTHGHFGHTQHPWPRMLAAGINVALGTDSRASNPDLRVWNEAIAIRRIAPKVSPRVVLEMLTANGSLALLGERESVLPGNSATFTVLDTAEPPTDFWSLFEHYSPTAACRDGIWTKRRD